MKVLSIVGARPQFIKVAALHRAIKKEKGLQHFILHTGQHYDYYLSEIFFKELQIPKPDFFLFADDNTQAASVHRMSMGIEKVLMVEKPEMVIVFGDTNSTLAGALAAKKLNISIAHIEAGLRSYNMAMPEENNRIETDRISNLLFCPTARAVSNLIAEGITSNQKVILSGDIMLDAMNFYSGRAYADNTIVSSLPPAFILCTLHRQSLVTSASQLKEVIKALNLAGKTIPLIMPAHPRFKSRITALGIEAHFTIIDPVGYLQMLSLLKCCQLVITDSGGLQKEAYFSKKICITVREETEWQELVEAGVNFVSGTSCSRILAALEMAGKASGNFSENFYGDGSSAAIVVKSLLGYREAIKGRAIL